MFPRFAKVKYKGAGVKLVPRENLTLAQLKILESSASGILQIDGGEDVGTQTAVDDTHAETQTMEGFDPEWLLGKKMKEMKLENLESVKGDVQNRGVDLVNNVRLQLEKLKLQLGKSAENTIFVNTSKLAALLLGVDQSTVQRAKKRGSRPKKKARGPKSRKAINEDALKLITDEGKEILMKHVEKCHNEEENFTVESLHDDLQNMYDFPYSPTTLFRMLKALRFSYKIKIYNPFCTVRKDIIVWRTRYLHEIEALRAAGATIAYYDETWLYKGIGHTRGWNPTDTNPYIVAHLADLSRPRPGFSAVNDKGQRAIILAILTEFGILPCSIDVVIAGRPDGEALVDYHQYMSAKMYKEYMMKVLPELVKATPNGRMPVLVIDNASTHNSVVEKIPTKSSNKAVLSEFLRGRGVAVAENATRDDLLAEFNSYVESQGGRKNMMVYEVDEYAKSLGVRIVRLPPYHCMFSPIELIWHQLKSHLRSVGKTTDKLEVVRQRAIDFLKNIPEATVAATYEHVLDIESNIMIAMGQDDDDSDSD